MTQRNGTQQNGEESQNFSPEDVQRVIQVGEHASQMLGSPVYNLAYRNVVDQIVMEWMESSPKETMKRESLYNQVTGLMGVTEKLSVAVEEARVVLSEQQAQNDPAAAQQEYTNNQGFGLN